MKLIYCVLTMLAVCVASVGHYRFTTCRDSTALAVSLSELEDLAFECARVQCPQMEDITDFAEQMRALLKDKAEQCLGAPQQEIKYGQEV